ncbi:alpha/beta hydrolase [Candidatus Bathyarchaeota archaeon]|nr:alpha/beta hydrolase [Candidatus Bathyarchaeota archaeon]
MRHAEITIDEGVYEVKADLKSPEDGGDRGVILAHGGFVNRKSLSRTGFCMAEYLSRELDAYVLTPDMAGETRVHKPGGLSLQDSVNVLGIGIDYLSDVLGVERIACFGHSLGSLILAKALESSRNVVAASTYGGPMASANMGRSLSYLSGVLNVGFLRNRTVSVDDVSKFFDGETRDYFYTVMMMHDEYGGDNYNLEYEFSYLMESIGFLTSYLERLKGWERPVLVSFGENDSVVRSPRKRYRGVERIGNIEFHVIPEGCHITPCREEPLEVSKMKPIRDFLERNLAYADEHGITMEHPEAPIPGTVSGE